MEYSDRATIIFGRMTPPHKGHEKLIKIAREFDGDKFIITTPTHDSKNWLDILTKVSTLEESFPDFYIVVLPLLNKGFYSALQHISNALYYHKVRIITGEDRYDDYKRIIDKYNYLCNGDGFFFETCDIIGVPRDDGISSTLMKSFVMDNNKNAFYDCLPSTLSTHKIRKAKLWKDCQKFLENNNENYASERFSCQNE